jgi:hypothetical protein
VTIGTEVLQLISAGVSILWLFVLYFKVILGIKMDIKELQTQIRPFVVMIERDLPKIMHSPHTPEADALLEKMQSGCPLTLDEIRELKQQLICNRQNGDYKKWLELPASMLITHLQGLEDKLIQELDGPPKTIWSVIRKWLT